MMLRNKAVRGGMRLCVSPARHLRAVDEAGPLARTTATPHLPWPEDRAKMVSASASPSGSPRQRNLQGGVTLLAKCNKSKFAWKLKDKNNNEKRILAFSPRCYKRPSLVTRSLRF